MASSRSYGRNALRGGISLNLSGLDEYLKRIEQAGKNAEDAVIMAIEESCEIVRADMVAGAERHKDKGEVVNAIKITPVKREGFMYYASVGIDLNEHPEAFHAVYQEYGDAHSPGFPDPFIRPAFDNNKSKVKKKQREVLIREGMPID